MNEIYIKELISIAVTDDRDTYQEIYDQTIDYVYRTVYFLHKDKAEVDDIVQEIYYQLFRSLCSFDISKPFRPWLASITTNQVSEARRKKWKLDRLVLKLFSFKQPLVADTLETVLNNECYEQIGKKVESLSPKLKEVILLKYVHEFSQDQIADILNIPVGTVKSRINLALSKLRSKSELSIIKTIKEGQNHGF